MLENAHWFHEQSIFKIFRGEFPKTRAEFITDLVSESASSGQESHFSLPIFRSH